MSDMVWCMYICISEPNSVFPLEAAEVCVRRRTKIVYVYVYVHGYVTARTWGGEQEKKMKQNNGEQDVCKMSLKIHNPHTRTHCTHQHQH